jgi:hypothetical protein
MVYGSNLIKPIESQARFKKALIKQIQWEGRVVKRD